MKKILYIMGIDWNWIYQRPQILAERLSKDYDITVVFPRSVVSGERRVPILNNIKMRILWTIPYQEKNSLIGKFASKIHGKIFDDINNFDAVFIGYPLYERYVPRDYPGKIIYDCMDNFEALYPDQKRVRNLIESEKKLINRSDMLIASSEMLLKKINETAEKPYGILVRNAANISGVEPIKQIQKKESYSLCYIGTLSNWFDYELLSYSLKIIPEINYHLIGPAISQMKNDRITYYGQISHDSLGKVIEQFDCLIMPFKINDIVRYVDPVKLYEYIAFGKCIISIYYEEVEQFKDFVYFYRTNEEYVRLLMELAEKGFPAKYTEKQREEFLNLNTWDKRYELIEDKMMAILK